jgi:hypothetical protein
MLRVDVTAWLHTEVLQAAEETGEVREGPLGTFTLAVPNELGGKVIPQFVLKAWNENCGCRLSAIAFFMGGRRLCDFIGIGLDQQLAMVTPDADAHGVQEAAAAAVSESMDEPLPAGSVCPQTRLKVEPAFIFPFELLQALQGTLRKPSGSFSFTQQVTSPFPVDSSWADEQCFARAIVCAKYGAVRAMHDHLLSLQQIGNNDHGYFSCGFHGKWPALNRLAYACLEVPGADAVAGEPETDGGTNIDYRDCKTPAVALQCIKTFSGFLVYFKKFQRHNQRNAGEEITRKLGELRVLLVRTAAMMGLIDVLAWVLANDPEPDGALASSIDSAGFRGYGDFHERFQSSNCFDFQSCLSIGELLTIAQDTAIAMSYQHCGDVLTWIWQHALHSQGDITPLHVAKLAVLSSNQPLLEAAFGTLVDKQAFVIAALTASAVALPSTGAWEPKPTFFADVRPAFKAFLRVQGEWWLNTPALAPARPSHYDRLKRELLDPLCFLQYELHTEEDEDEDEDGGDVYHDNGIAWNSRHGHCTFDKGALVWLLRHPETSGALTVLSGAQRAAVLHYFIRAWGLNSDQHCSRMGQMKVFYDVVELLMDRHACPLEPVTVQAIVKAGDLKLLEMCISRARPVVFHGGPDQPDALDAGLHLLLHSNNGLTRHQKWVDGGTAQCVLHLLEQGHAVHPRHWRHHLTLSFEAENLTPPLQQWVLLRFMLDSGSALPPADVVARVAARLESEEERRRECEDANDGTLEDNLLLDALRAGSVTRDDIAHYKRWLLARMDPQRPQPAAAPDSLLIESKLGCVSPGSRDDKDWCCLYHMAKHCMHVRRKGGGDGNGAKPPKRQKAGGTGTDS